MGKNENGFSRDRRLHHFARRAILVDVCVLGWGVDVLCCHDERAVMSDPGLNMATGNRVHSIAVRKDDLYETPPAAVRALLSVEPVPLTVWEPACGPGAIVRELRASGRAVIATDLVEYGCPDSIPRRDFLMEREPPPGVPAICTNPPFKNADEFTAHAISLVPEVYMLMRVAFLEGLRWYESGHSNCLGLSKHLARVWVFAPRLDMMHRADWDGPKANSGIAFAWFVFMHDSRKMRGPARLGWLNPRDFKDEAA